MNIYIISGIIKYRDISISDN